MDRPMTPIPTQPILLMIPPQIQFKISANPQCDVADTIQDKCQSAMRFNCQIQARLGHPAAKYIIKNYNFSTL
jgi:hypothetical protein